MFDFFQSIGTKYNNFYKKHNFVFGFTVLLRMVTSVAMTCVCRHLHFLKINNI